MNTYILLFLQGIISFFSPCILPLLPVYLIYLAANARQRLQRRLINIVAFILGFSGIFVALGVSAAGLARILLSNRILLTQIAGCLIILLGIYYMFYQSIMKSALKRQLDYFLLSIGWNRSGLILDKLKEKALNEKEKTHFWGALLFGVAFSLTASPCISPNLSYALLLAAESSTAYQGALLLLLYSLGMAIPFMLVAFFANYLQGILQHFARYTNICQKLAAILMIIVGCFLLSGTLHTYLISIQKLFS